MADSAYQRAKTLLDYVKAKSPKYGPSSSENMGSGPGGAAATNMKVSKQMADLAASPMNSGEDNVRRRQITDDVNQLKMQRSISQMEQVRDIYNTAVDTVNKKKKRYQ